jgi:hypothetical protein
MLISVNRFVQAKECRPVTIKELKAVIIVSVQEIVSIHSVALCFLSKYAPKIKVKLA